MKCKWVNDIFIEDKKVGGILSKCDIHGQKILATLGIGININEAPIETSTCLNKYASKQIKVLDFSKKLISNINKELKNEKDSLEYYRSHLLYLNEEVKIMDVPLTKVLQ